MIAVTAIPMSNKTPPTMPKAIPTTLELPGSFPTTAVVGGPDAITGCVVAMPVVEVEVMDGPVVNWNDAVVAWPVVIIAEVVEVEVPVVMPAVTLGEEPT